MKTPQMTESDATRQNVFAGTALFNGSLDARFDRMTRLAQQALNTPIALVSLIDQERLLFKSRQGLDIQEMAREHSFCGSVILDSAPLIVEDALNDERFSTLPMVQEAPYIRFYAGVPLHTATGDRVGVLCLMDTQPRSFTDAQIAMLCDMAGVVEELIQSDIGNRESQTELATALKESERRARLVIEGTGVGTWQWNIQTGETIFNERWASIVGYTLEELLPTSIDTWLSLAHPDDLATSEALLKAHFAGETESYDCKARMRHKLGHWVWVHDRGQVFDRTPAGEPLLMYGTHADITEEVAAQQAIKASRDELASLLSNMPGVTYRRLPNDSWTMLYISGQIERISGYPAEDLLDNQHISYAELIHSHDVPYIDNAIAKAQRLKEGWHLEYRIRHQNGSWRWVEERGNWVAGNVQYPKIMEGFIVDITREYEARTQLRKHHDALLLLNDIAFNPLETLDAKIQYALVKAKQYLGLDLAILSQIEGGVYTVRWVDAEADAGIYAGQHFAVDHTWCQLLFTGQNTELFIADVPSSQFHAHPCYQTIPLGAYAGIVIEAEGQVFGTLNFSSTQARPADFDESETLFLRLLARWLSDTLANSLSNERITKLMAQLPGVIYQYRQFPDGRSTFPFSSPQLLELYGLLPNQAAQDASPVFKLIHPDDLDYVVATITHSANTLEDWHAAYRARTQDGSYRWVAGQARPERLTDGSTLWHGYLHDIHEQELSRKALERNESRLRGLFEFAPIGIALNDLKTGQFIDLNDALVRPSGYSREEFVKLSYWDLTPAEYQAKEEEALASLQSNGQYGPFEKEYIRKDGSRYPVRLQGMLSQDPDGRLVIWSLVEDITERRRLDKMKNQFISTVSHELRTPLTSINGSLGLIAGGAVGTLPPAVSTLLDTAQRNVQRLATLINDLLDMEKLVAGKMLMNLTAQPLTPLVNEAIDSLAGYGEQHQVAISPSGDWPEIQVEVDGPRLIQALTNLMSNAIKFSPKGDTVVVSIGYKSGEATITVRDRGPGVAPAFQSQLFQRFSQADSSDTRQLPGTGLGLAITREITQQLGGEVHYRDAAGGGSEFYIKLPGSLLDKPPVN
ncbi:PAS domain-containing protein [Vreelandella aquamarina]|uniref:PAS domain-containing protein n=1 Tax=Vreelandella aquamarina TaxID=77097 RepID=UPI00384CBAA7